MFQLVYFLIQVQLMGMLNNENVVKLIDYIESSSSCYVVMEYCDGGDLESLFSLHAILYFFTYKNYYEKRKI